jgi:hypothetical protein
MYNTSSHLNQSLFVIKSLCLSAFFECNYLSKLEVYFRGVVQNCEKDGKTQQSQLGVNT